MKKDPEHLSLGQFTHGDDLDNLLNIVNLKHRSQGMNFEDV
jgi:hypothetical protein